MRMHHADHLTDFLAFCVLLRVDPELFVRLDRDVDAGKYCCLRPIASRSPQHSFGYSAAACARIAFKMCFRMSAPCDQGNGREATERQRVALAEARDAALTQRGVALV